jgi:hypothetical protein
MASAYQASSWKRKSIGDVIHEFGFSYLLGDG